MTDTLFSEFKLGRVTLKNRVVMAPMTRNRSPGNVPADFVATYYGQRAEAGLIITEGTSPSPNGLGYPRMPGLFNAEQVASWKKVTEAVHAKGSRIYVQLMHTGRVAHALNLPVGARVLAPSAVALEGTIYTDQQGPQPHTAPVAMTEADIEVALGEFVASAKLAMDAGFDGVELHGANGYLIEQFLNANANKRTDAWGGTVEGRAHFAAEVARRTAAAIGADRVGIRLSPAGGAGGLLPDAQTDAVYLQLMKELKAIGLVYVHVVDHSAMGAPKPKAELYNGMREAFGGTFIVSGGFTAKDAAATAIKERRGDLVAFGRPFIGNPNLVTKLKEGRELRAPNFALAYTPGAEGYTDYAAD